MVREPESHAAPLRLLAGEWAAARDAVEAIDYGGASRPCTHGITEARYRTGGLDAAWPLLAELAWLAPARFAALLPIRGDASLDALRRRFATPIFRVPERSTNTWLPAWLLVVKPALAARLREARVQRDQAASRATALLGGILRWEHEGDQHELVGLRQHLSRLHAGLFDAYMATREARHR